MLRLRRCELIPLFTPLSHCHKQRQTHSLASRILFAVIVPPPLKFLIALCCLLIHALSFPQITMGYSVRRILAQCETKYEPSIRCVNCSQHTSYIQARCCYAGLNSERIFSLLFWFYNLVETYCWCSMCLVYWKSLTQAVAFAKLLWDLD